MSEEPHRMLRPEELQNVVSRELKFDIDLEKEHFDEVNVKLSSDDEEDNTPKVQNNQAQSKPQIVQRNVKLQSREVNIEKPAGTPNLTAKAKSVANNSVVEEKKTSPVVYIGAAVVAAAVGIILMKFLRH